MDMMQLRRKVIGQAKKPLYVMNGLVLWLDGIDKGNVSGSWVDKISGYVFEGVNNPTFGDNYVATSAINDSYLLNSDFNTPLSETGTIEVCVSDFSVSGNQLIYMPAEIAGEPVSFSYKLAFGMYSGNAIIWTASAKSRPMVSFTQGFSVVSTNGTVSVVDGQEKQLSTNASYWGSQNQKNYIGRRYSGNGFTGKIHAIRIYDRQLTADEMIYNQRIDNKRFNLGLTI